MSPPRRKRHFFFCKEHRLNGEGEGDSTMGTQKPSFLGVISPIFLGPKTSKTFIFHGFWGPMVVGGFSPTHLSHEEKPLLLSIELLVG